ncbi:hypothetical protein [Streptomyces shenzhenensis]|uniref:hypothetical protein n=1 Tax=Streptomyces shenzhenensis TaxID=943815 RepID=UPI0015F00691|nr:hypothetical protein [Streptomyces shenzhenensis]
MDHAACNGNQQSLVDPLMAVTAAFECEEIAATRDLARALLTEHAGAARFPALIGDLGSPI